MTLPSGRDWLFSIKTFSAGMLAVYIGLMMALPRPYWALATVYICSQPLSGATRSKAAFRVIGTLIGAVAAIVLVPALVNAPVLLVGSIILWISVCLYFSLLDRSPRSYTFMLAGYTAALIGFPAVLDPGSIFDTALARVEEITLGIVCASLVSSLVWPSSVGAVVARRASSWISNAARLSIDALQGRGSSDTARRELVRLAGDAGEIDLLTTHLAYDTSGAREVLGHIRATQTRMLLLLPVLSSIADRVAALRSVGGQLPPKLVPVVDGLVAWINPGDLSTDKADQAHERETAQQLRQAIEAAAPPLNAGASWPDILSVSLLLRMRELIDIATDTRMLRRAIRAGRTSLPYRLAFDPGIGTSSYRHRDHAMALLSCFGVALATLICCVLWIQTGWPDGSAAPMMAAVACCFFASRDDPVPAILQFANWTLVAVVIMAVYQFAIIPVVHDFEMLALVLAPTFLLFGVLISMPATMGVGLALAANGSTVLALQNTFAADFASYANSNIALLVGMYSGAVVMRITRSVGAEWATWRLIGVGRNALARAANRRGRGDRGRFAALMLDRIGLIAPRLASIGPNSAVNLVDLLGGTRIGLNIVDLRRARHDVPSNVKIKIDALLDILGRHYADTPEKSSQALLGCIDDALTAITRLDAGLGKRDALLGFVGIRRGLFPDALPYEPALSGAPLPERNAA